MNIKDLVKDTKVRFLYYRKGELWYEVLPKNSDAVFMESPDADGFCKMTKILHQPLFQFPVPIEDTGDGTFNAEDKAMLFMRYIRKQLERLENETIERELTSHQEAQDFLNAKH